MYDHAQLTNGVPNGVRCTGGELNGTKPGFWAEYPVTEDSANWTRVWKCPIPGTCLKTLLPFFSPDFRTA